MRQKNEAYIRYKGGDREERGEGISCNSRGRKGGGVKGQKDAWFIPQK